ncbi:MAG TPA: T9SS type A sorting domain-containing protein [Flavipsychrobacter sp.]|nr:T9SS type A sorting domain-containing protein [Flavipsychrobacter sp.]
MTFYVSRTAKSRYAIDRIGAYFDDGSIDTTTTPGLPQTQYSPQVENMLGLLIDTLNWVKIEGAFIADGTEKFITIGNFYNKANTNYLEVPSYDNPSSHYTWYFIDDVSVINSNLPAYAGPDVWMVQGDSVFIGRTPEVGLECKWYIGTSVVDSGAGIWAKPTASTTYIVEQTLCGLVKRDTVNVQVVPVSVNGITNSRQLSIYPNPANNTLTVSQEKVIFNSVSVINGVGQQVSSFPLNEKETRLDIGALPAGVYYLQLNGDKGREVRSFVKM